MLRSFSISFLFAFTLLACGPGAESNTSSVQTVDSLPLSSAGAPVFQTVYATVLSEVEPLSIPAWIHVDSVGNNRYQLQHAEALVVFPDGFGIPEEVNVFAFATHEVDDTTRAVWYKMEVQGSSNSDIWVVLYGDAGVLAANLVATKGNGEGYGKIDSPASIRQVFIQPGEKMIVTTKVVSMENGRFITRDEQSSTFSDTGNLQEPKAKSLIEKFFE